MAGKKNDFKKASIEQIEKQRQLVVWKLFVMIMLLILIILLAYKINEGTISDAEATIIAFVMIIVYIINCIDRYKFEELYKNNIVEACLKNKFTDVSYKPFSGLSKSKIASVGMVNTGDRVCANDYVKAKYKDVNFECSDIDVQKRYTDSDGNTSYTSIFKGQWYIFEFNKQFKSKVGVYEKCFESCIRENFIYTDGLKKVELEDVEFHKDFRVYAKKEVEAFYILTPQIIERIKKLNEEIAGKFFFCFCNNKLHVGLCNNKDLYEHSIFSKINLEKENKKILGELMTIINFVDTLKLDNNLFKRDIELEVKEKEKSLNKKSSNKDDKK